MGGGAGEDIVQVEVGEELQSPGRVSWGLEGAGSGPRKAWTCWRDQGRLVMGTVAVALESSPETNTSHPGM